MEKAITPKTKLILFCHPHNPVGRVYRREELEQLADFSRRHNLIVCSDEVHNGLIFDQRQHIMFSSLGEEEAMRTITLMSPSKTYNLPGLCCAYAIIPNPQLREAFLREKRGLITEINLFGLVGCECAYRYGEKWRLELIQYLQANRDFLISFFAQHLPEITVFPVEGTYLAWLDLRKLQLPDPAAFFEQAGVGLSDGNYFGADGYMRLNFACSRSILQLALERMLKVVRSSSRA